MDAPKTMAEAQARRHQLTEEIQAINFELGDTNRQDETGRRMPYREYQEWRKAKLVERDNRLTEVRVIKNWMREQGESRRNEALPHLRNLVAVVRDIHPDDLDTEEREHLEAAEAYLDCVGS